MTDKIILQEIQNKTYEQNKNNVTRTMAYLRFYQYFPKIKWAFLASMVSRNAGWNMTDLSTKTYKLLLSKRMLRYLFMTYERANWFIFSDAYPQLLLYNYSIKLNKPLFYLFDYFYISMFMKKEWMHFWDKKEENRLLYALIINEQNLIQKPVVLQSFFKHNVFHSIPYKAQELLHLNYVLFPTLHGELFGISIKNFTNTTSRIVTGKRLASILFYPEYYPNYLTFASKVNPTGSRKEYEQFLDESLIWSKELEEVFPNIHHENYERRDWYSETTFQEKWWDSIQENPARMEMMFYKKRKTVAKVAKIVGKIKKQRP